MNEKYKEFYERFMKLCEEYGVDMVIQLIPKEESDKLENKLATINDGRQAVN